MSRQGKCKATRNEHLGTFRDGVAIGLPLGDAPAFFCMGQLDHYINIWHWKADWQSDIDRRAARAPEKKDGGVRTFEVIPRRVSSVEDLIGGGFSTLTTKDKQGRVQGQGFWKDGVWHVMMRRPLLSEEQENEATLVPGRTDKSVQEHVEILDAILTLDDLHRAKKISDEAYHKRRAELKGMLKNEIGD